MKKIINNILIILLFLVNLSSCQHNNTQPTESIKDKESVEITDESSSNETQCEEHNVEDWEVIKRATLENEGIESGVCSICNQTQNRTYSIVNSKDYGINSIEITAAAVSYTLSAKYYQKSIEIQINTKDKMDLDKIDIYATGYANQMLDYGKAYKFSIKVNEGANELYMYAYNEFNLPIVSDYECTVTENNIKLNIPYDTLMTNFSSGYNNFAFYPVFHRNGEEYKYKNHMYMLEKYNQTWFNLNDKNNIYYDEYYSTYASRYKDNWVKPSFKDPEAMFVGVIKEPSVESAIVAMAIAERKGAMGFDLHLNYLYNNNLLTVKNIEKIVKASQLPILALNYNSALSQQDRLAGLLLAAEAGVAAVDFQGFMYWEGSTLNTQTDENIAYWENQGFDMCFVNANPKETVLDKEAVNNQVAFAQQIHNMGAEILMSAHIDTVFDAKQAVAFAEFNIAKGMDIVKIVGLGYNQVDVLECVEACRLFSQSKAIQEANAKVSFHLSGDPAAYITRVLCPSFYNSHVAFCWGELTEGQDANQLDLDMAIECYNIAKKANVTSSIDVKSALEILKAECKHEQFLRLVRDFENSHSVVAQAYGASSNLSNRWNINKDNYYIQLRDASGTNKFNIRALAYDASICSDDLWISAEISGNYSAFASSNMATTIRSPKVGLYLGDKENMLAFVYNSTSKKLDLMKLNEGLKFEYDSNPIGDRLYTANIIEPKSSTSDVANGTIRLAIHKTATTVSLFFAKDASSLWEQIAEINLTDEIKSYFTNENGKCYAGVLAELYLGSSSVGKVNEVTYKVSYEQINI